MLEHISPAGQIKAANALFVNIYICCFGLDGRQEDGEYILSFCSCLVRGVINVLALQSLASHHWVQIHLGSTPPPTHGGFHRVVVRWWG